jgi:predicted Zn-dependent protease
VPRAALEALIMANDGQEAADLYRSILATLDFEEGRRDEAILTLQEIVETADASDQTRRIKTALARMLIEIDNPVGGRALVEEVLAEDPSNVEALKIRAQFLIDEDQPDEAINDLRTAQRQAPRDPQIMTLMATAFERAGSRELAGERLALAVDISGSAPEESVRYAAFLRQDGRNQAAETVLLDARRANPGNVQVVEALADLWLSTQNWTNLQGLMAALEGVNTEAALELATRIRTAMLVRQNRSDDLMALLQNQASEGEEGLRNTVTIVLTQVRAGRVDEARAFLDEALAETPGTFELQLVDAALRQLTGEIDAAEEVLRGMIADFPDREQPVRMLYSLLVSAERRDEAREVLDAALAVQPDNLVLRWIKAGNLEQAGDIDGAIAIYEEMYALNSANMIVANNLASLLATHRTDEESLERAWAVARRLRGQEVPAFQDTYGWIATRRGDPEEALPYLESAAEGLPEDPLVQYHLGMTYVALERTDEARATLTRALEIAGDSTLPQFDRAREVLSGLDGAAEPDGDAGETPDQ